MDTDPFMLIAIIVLAAGGLLLFGSSMSFHFRAIANKPAWDGMTRPLLGIGAVVFVIGLVLVFLAYKAAFPNG